MPQFRKKPVVVQAIQWDGTNLDEVIKFCAGAASIQKLMPGGGHALIIKTLEDGPNGEAKHVADLMDWIIEGVKMTYEPDVFMPGLAAGLAGLWNPVGK